MKTGKRTTFKAWLQAITAVSTLFFSTTGQAGDHWLSRVRILDQNDQETILTSKSFKSNMSLADMKATANTAVFDLTIELEENPQGDDKYPDDSGSSDDAQNSFEARIEQFADAVYQATNGVHKIGKVTIYRDVEDSKKTKKADVWWEKDCASTNGPWANPNGFGVAGDYIHMCTNWSGASTMSTAKGGGYTLAHEWGHYTYGLYDEYAASQCTSDPCYYTPKSSDTPAVPSIMNMQWYAADGTKPSGYAVSSNDFLEYSTENIDPYKATSSGETGHKRIFNESGWETLTRDPATDPKYSWLTGKRTQYTTLTAPTSPNFIVNNSIDTTITRSELKIIWVGEQVVELTIDRSGSMDGTPIQNAQTAANLLIEQLPEGGAAIGVASFASSVSQDYPITDIPNPDTGVKTAAKSAVDGITANGWTSLYDGLISALNNIQSFQTSTGTSRSAVVYVLSDGGDNDSSAAESDVISAYQAAGIPIISFAYGYYAPTGTLKRMADDTGGSFFEAPTSLEDIQRVFLAANAAYSSNMYVADSSSDISAGTTTNKIVNLDSTLNTITINLTFTGSIGDLDLSLFLPTGSDSGKNFDCIDSGDDVSCSLTLDETFMATYGSGEYVVQFTNNTGDEKEVNLLVSATAAGTEPYDIVLSLDDIEYPDPLIIRATVLKGILPLAGMDVTATIKKPDDTETIVQLLDDGVGADSIAGDGTYSSAFAYDQDGTYSVIARASNATGNAITTYESINVSVAENGDGIIPTPVSITENFTRVALVSGVVSGVEYDDHEDNPTDYTTCTVIQDDNIDTAGRIDFAGDVDCFFITPGSVSDSIVFRATGLSGGMEPVLTVYKQDGSTKIKSADLTSSENSDSGVIMTLSPIQLDLAGHVITIKHQDSSATEGSYAISAGEPLTSDKKTTKKFNWGMFLPAITNHK